MREDPAQKILLKVLRKDSSERFCEKIPRKDSAKRFRGKRTLGKTTKHVILRFSITGEVSACSGVPDSIPLSTHDGATASLTGTRCA